MFLIHDGVVEPVSSERYSHWRDIHTEYYSLFSFKTVLHIKRKAKAVYPDGTIKWGRHIRLE